MQAFPPVLGTSGARELVEPHVRCLVADHLGVDQHELGSRVSLRDDLAADSLDVLELTLALENDFGVSVPNRVADGVVTYGDLVETMVDLVVARARDCRAIAEQPPRFWAQLASGVSSGTLACSGILTPYTAETLARDAGMAGSGAQLDVVVAPGTADLDLARVRARFAHLTARGVHVNVDRDPVREAPAAVV
jgi:acyl carrier protein